MIIYFFFFDAAYILSITHRSLQSTSFTTLSSPKKESSQDYYNRKSALHCPNNLVQLFLIALKALYSIDTFWFLIDNDLFSYSYLLSLTINACNGPNGGSLLPIADALPTPVTKK